MKVLPFELDVCLAAFLIARLTPDDMMSEQSKRQALLVVPSDVRSYIDET